VLKFSRRIDYSLVALAHLAREGGLKPISAKEIARRYKLPRPLLANVLKHLSHVGIVHSVRGVRGGYLLRRDPASISLGELVEAIEGPVRLTLCASPDGPSCLIESNCPVRTPIRRFHETIGEILAHVTLADLSGGRRPASASA